MKAHIFYLVTTLSLTLACGEDQPASNPVASPKIDSENFTPEFNIDDGWHVSTKRCGPSHTLALELESYRFDSLYFVQIRKLLENDSMLCKIGFVYERIISTSRSNLTAYFENSTLRPTMTKKTCWKKRDGQLTEQTISDNVFEFNGQNASLELVYSQSAIHLTLKNMKDCPEDVLHLVLQNK